MVKLLEVFNDFEVKVRGKSYHGRYDAEYLIVPKTNPRRLTLEDLQQYIRKLQQRYPNHNFYLRHTHVRGREYWIITRKSYYVGEDGKRHRVKERVPIYIDLENQKFFVPESYVKNKRRLTNYICMVTLGSLGISKTKYNGR